MKDLSPRETQIVELCMEGLTNEAIAHRLGIGVGTVNTYWLRIKMKAGASGRTETIAKIIKERAEHALRESNVERGAFAELVAEKERSVLELRAAIALLHLAMDQIKSTVWATDNDLAIHILANGVFPSIHFGVSWEVGKTVYELFKTEDPKDPAIAAHLAALSGTEAETRLAGDYANMHLRVIPLTDEADVVMGCIAVLNAIGN